MLLLQCPPPGVDPQQNVSSPGRVQHREVRDSHPLIPVLGSLQKLPSGIAQVLSYSILQLQPSASEVAVPEGPAALHCPHSSLGHHQQEPELGMMTGCAPPP